MIIGVVGETGSGKNIFCQKIKELKKSVTIVSSSLILREALQIFVPNSEITKEDLQWMALVLFDRFGKEVLSNAVKKRMQENRDEIVVFDGVRMWSDYEMIRSLGGKIVYITADSRLRWERIQKRREKKDDNVPYKKFLEIEKAATETSISQIGGKADIKIENNGSLDDFYAKIKEVI